MLDSPSGWLAGQGGHGGGDGGHGGGHSDHGGGHGVRSSGGESMVLVLLLFLDAKHL